jgi:hypothetical protein
VYRDEKLLVEHMEKRYVFGLLRLDLPVQMISHSSPKSWGPMGEAVKPLVGVRSDVEHFVSLYRAYVYRLVKDLKNSANELCMCDQVGRQEFLFVWARSVAGAAGMWFSSDTIRGDQVR